MKTQLKITTKRLFLILALAGLFLIAAACTTPAETNTETSTTAVTEAIAAEAAAASVDQPEPVAEIAGGEPSAAEVVAEDAAVDPVVEPEATAVAAPESPAVVDVSTSVNVLSDSETADLLYMREEEKLAHDVYIALYNVWGTAVFQNIAASEQTHTDSVLSLLNSYGLTDPVGSNPAGVFVSADLQALYDQLVASGSQSLADALRVGAAIEEIDILDLDEAIAQTSQADIAQMYQSLRAGSENHLRAFVSTLERQTGETYQPQYLSPGLYAAIISGTQSQGNGNVGGNGKGNGRGGNG